MPIMCIHQANVRLPQGLLTQVPLRGPREGVFGDAGGVGHPGVPEVARIREHGRVEVADQVGVARLSAAGVGERLSESGVAVDLDEQRWEVQKSSRCATHASTGMSSVVGSV
jgi:hypothetical protein